MKAGQDSVQGVGRKDRRCRCTGQHRSRVEGADAWRSAESRGKPVLVSPHRFGDTHSHCRHLQVWIARVRSRSFSEDSSGRGARREMDVMWISRGDRKVAKRGGAEAEAGRCRCCCARAPSRGATTMRISFRESETFEVV